jgi:exodeoxyribonuclease VII large subunit
MCDPMAVLGPHYLRLDGAAGTLARVIPERLARDREALDRHRDALRRSGARLLDRPVERVDRAAAAALDVGPRLLVSHELGIAHAAERLEDLSPLAILGRGYAVCYRPDGSVERAAREIAPGERVDVRLAEGRLGCAVETIEVEG